jgi:hypothetical protein
MKGEIQAQLNKLNKDEIHIVYFINTIRLSDIFKDPLKIVLKIYNLIAREKIDHVAHISRFISDDENQYPKIFEATRELGMQQNDLFDRIEAHDGKVIIESTGKKVDKIKAKEFEKKFYGKPYSEVGAALAGLDGWFNRFKAKEDKLFCSYLVALFLNDQNVVDIKNPQEMTPTDIFNLNLKTK